MDKQIKKKILTLLSLLSSEQKQKKILELNKNTDKKIIEFLTEVGVTTCEFKKNQNSIESYLSEKSGKVNLWYKDIGGTWIIKIYHINRLILDNKL